MAEIYFKEESYEIIAACLEVHKALGNGFKEIVYKDALELEFINRKITCERERQFKIEYKGLVLKHRFYADFIVFNSIILEIKATPYIGNPFVSQTINYL